ncbi:MAG: sterol desaturase family protein [Candidatus Marinimicrobia bacterium]|nr:sterol desaturase family protein [Candidatus Neomarinimicrobiota bacterium]
MEQWIIDSEAAIRLGFFIGIFVIISIWELIAPRRPLHFSKPIRWYSNIGLVILNSLVMRWLFPVLATGLALIAQERGWGLFNNVNMTYELRIVLSVIAMDFIIYLQHAMFHALPLLWRLHRMHHTDLDYDVTTGARFHPLEIIISMFIKLAIIALIGPPVLSVIIFEVVLNFTAMFNHGNIRIPVKIDRVLRLVVVTPDMHRVHHSVIPKETNTNFGFNLPWWDHLFGTYCHQPEKGHEGMTIGLNQFRNPKNLHLHMLFIQPFLDSTDDYAINKRKQNMV